MKPDDSLSRSDSDDSIRQMQLEKQIAQLQSRQQIDFDAAYEPEPQEFSWSSSNLYRRLSNPDISPTSQRRNSMNSFSQEDILSNDDLHQIHFDPRYRDYRSSVSLNLNTNYRSRSNSMSSIRSNRGIGNRGTSLYIPRKPQQSPPPIVIQQWDNNPTIMVEEYVDDKIDDENSFKSDDLKTVLSNSGSYQALCESDIKSIGDSNDIPFIDDEELGETSSLDGHGDERRNSTGCRKTVSFDVINSQKAARMFVNLNDGNDKKSNLNKTQNSYQCFSDAPDAARLRNVMRNILSENDVNSNPSYPTITQYIPPSCDKPFSISENVDHCILVDKLKQLKSEQFDSDVTDSSLKRTAKKMDENLSSYRIRWDGNFDVESLEEKTAEFESKPLKNQRKPFEEPLKNQKPSEEPLKNQNPLEFQIKIEKSNENRKPLNMHTKPFENPTKPMITDEKPIANRNPFENLKKQLKIQKPLTNSETPLKTPIKPVKTGESLLKNQEDDVPVCEGKVKALATYYNSLRFPREDRYQSTPNLLGSGEENGETPSKSVRKFSQVEGKLSKDEQRHVLDQLKEWSKFGLKERKDSKLLCTFLKRAQSTPILNLNNEDFGSCKSYKELLNRIDKIDQCRKKGFPNITEYVVCDDLVQHFPPDCFILHKKLACNPNCKNVENILIDLKVERRDGKLRGNSSCYASDPTLLGEAGEFERHPCRSPCFNPRKQKSIKQLKNQRQRKKTNEIRAPFVPSSSLISLPAAEQEKQQIPTTKPFLFNINNAMSDSLT